MPQFNDDAFVVGAFSLGLHFCYICCTNNAYIIHCLTDNMVKRQKDLWLDAGWSEGHQSASGYKL